MKEIEWTKSLEGWPLAFGRYAPIEKGRRVLVDEETAARAIGAGLAVMVSSAKKSGRRRAKSAPPDPED